MGRKIKVAAAQMSFGNDIAKNLKAMEAAIRGLARKRVKLAVFPECCLSGYLIPAKDRDWPAIRACTARAGWRPPTGWWSPTAT